VTAHLEHARLMRPFPVKRLTDALYHVQADAGQIAAVLVAVQTDPPRTPEAWVTELEHLLALLASLELRCRDAVPALEVLADQADADFERAVSAMLAILRGLGFDGVEERAA
jgi:hypothetical protein